MESPGMASQPTARTQSPVLERPSTRSKACMSFTNNSNNHNNKSSNNNDYNRNETWPMQTANLCMNSSARTMLRGCVGGYAVFIACIEILGISSFVPYAILLTRGVFPTGSPGLKPADPLEIAALNEDELRFNVHVLVPTYKESLEIVAATVNAALEADLPAGSRRIVSTSCPRRAALRSQIGCATRGLRGCCAGVAVSVAMVQWQWWGVGGVIIIHDGGGGGGGWKWWWTAVVDGVRKRGVPPTPKSAAKAGSPFHTT
eukprot:364282-Chlamydomonas_euryale.AAC.9